MTDIYRSIPGWEDCYVINEAGDVLSLERTVVRGNGTYRVQRRRLRHSKKANGLRRVTLCRAGRRHRKYVHKLLQQVWGS
jgi:hypothetical protein